ncbi:DUF6247 family protein [Streptomyces poonensis]|uniref:Uncharacterized protein n=1 Tax=Streptomyces poonensis TaxID=68255 RepID=A0A918UEJ4_9ACTN|nr:DUF6247 family protein [Streptomyces poonensis]GGY96171.1 hypothetical protein GCM10010365_13850 [Streptomyces poonensis]GLJ88916.1 hypothetical protein GCM10017589_15160 [Streptomyces poonensis]
MAAHVADPDRFVPPMPERTPMALRRAIALYTPQLLPDFDAHWKRAIGDTYDVGPVSAFLARWWCEYAIARDPELDAHVIGLQHRAAEATDIAEARVLLEEVAKIRYGTRDLEPGE